MAQQLTEDLRIVLVGKTGNGKSASANTILGREDFKVDDSYDSVTDICESQHATFNGRQITVIDTPGLCDTKKKEDDLKRDIEKCVELSVPGPHAFLLVMKLDLRPTDEETDAVKWIQESFGERAAQFTILLFTHFDANGMKKLKNGSIQKIINKCGGRFHGFNNNDRENRKQVEELLDKIEAMVKKNGGGYYTNQMYEDAQSRIREGGYYTNQMYEDAQRPIREAEKKKREEEERKKNEEIERVVARKLKEIEEKKKASLGGEVRSGAATGAMGQSTIREAEEEERKKEEEIERVVAKKLKEIEEKKKASLGGEVRSGAATGAIGGATLGTAVAGPVGTVVGGAVGAVTGTVGGLIKGLLNK